MMIMVIMVHSPQKQVSKMSSYFDLVPNFDYVSRLPDAKISDYIRVKNFFRRATLREDIFQDLAFFTKYSIKGDDRPDNVANQLYENPNQIGLFYLRTI